MTHEMLIVFGILAGAVVLFASGRVRPDLVAILVVLALNLSGVLTIQEALAGFGQPEASGQSSPRRGVLETESREQGRRRNAIGSAPWHNLEFFVMHDVHKIRCKLGNFSF